MTIIFPSDTKEKIDAIRDAIGRTVVFYTETYSGCYNCNINPVTNVSVNSFCPVCSGLYWIPTLSGYETIAHITWGKIGNLNWQTGGKLFDGDCLVQIEYTPDNLKAVNSCVFVVVDTIEMEIKSKEFRGVKEINRVLLNLVER